LVIITALKLTHVYSWHQVSSDHTSTPCPNKIKKVPLIFSQYRVQVCIRIFVMFGMQLCKWILII